MELTPKQLELKEEIKAACNVERRAYDVTKELIARCKAAGHVVEIKTEPEYKTKYWEDWGHARCEVCGLGLGWYCPENPNHYCEYNNGDDDQCDHCGEPEERR